MEQLKNIALSSDGALYRIEGERNSGLRRYVFSTAETRAIINDPFVLGFDYTDKLRTGIEYFLGTYKKLWPFAFDSVHTNVMHFLRGGLNFYLRDALAHAYGWNDHGCTFLSSQRGVDESGRWFIKEDSYGKITIGKGSVIFLGDVVATGVTLDHGLFKLTEAIKERKGSIRYLVFFNIGCHKAEKILEKYHDLWKKTFSDFEGIDLVYIEGKFHLADTKTDVRIKILGTDLLKKNALMTPELIASQSENIAYPLERCVIYDAGSRAFDIHEYLEDVHDYWKQNLALVGEGYTTEKLLKERFPDADETLYMLAKKTDFKDLCERQIQRAHL